ncbi:hypothetical protein [Ulvibacter litoralis]|nr:hypothetical protein [Ulvibacter litoralis]
MKDELQFLENLVAAHALEVISEASSEKSKEIKQELESHKEILEKLLKELELHSNNLQILMDDEDVPGELEVYKNEHYRLLIEEMNFHSAVKKTKKNIFDMLSEIFKKNKQKKLT